MLVDFDPRFWVNAHIPGMLEYLKQVSTGGGPPVISIKIGGAGWLPRVILA